MTTAMKTANLFMVSPCKQHARWAHPLEAATLCPGWTDCSAMNDTEFDKFMLGGAA